MFSTGKKVQSGKKFRVSSAALVFYLHASTATEGCLGRTTYAAPLPRGCDIDVTATGEGSTSSGDGEISRGSSRGAFEDHFSCEKAQHQEVDEHKEDIAAFGHPPAYFLTQGKNASNVKELQKTLKLFSTPNKRKSMLETAQSNLQKWADQRGADAAAQKEGPWERHSHCESGFLQESAPRAEETGTAAVNSSFNSSSAAEPLVIVADAPWSVLAAALTKHYGRTFAVLNLASSHSTGGHYYEGEQA